MNERAQEVPKAEAAGSVSPAKPIGVIDAFPEKPRDLDGCAVLLMVLSPVILAALFIGIFMDDSDVLVPQFCIFIAGLVYFVCQFFYLFKAHRWWKPFAVCILGILFAGIYQPWGESFNGDWKDFGSGMGEAVGHFFFGAPMVCAIGFWLALAATLIVFCWRKAQARKLLNQRLAVLAVEELKSGRVDKLIWAQAIVAAAGNETRARAEYIKLRAKQSK